MSLTTLDEIRNKLKGRWQKGVYLKAEVSDEGLFPLQCSLKIPPSTELVKNFDQIREWIKKIQKDCEKQGFEICWKDINHRQLGRNRLPSHILLGSIDELAAWLGKKNELKQFRRAYSKLIELMPILSSWAASRPFELIEKAELIEPLVTVVRWLQEHPRPEIYIRQLSLPGIDTKFIEANRVTLSSWLDIILESEYIDESYKGSSVFAKRYGFLSRPELIRFRILDQNLASSLACPFSDLSVPASEFASWDPPVKRIVVIENDVTVLAFPPVFDALLLFGRGYNFNALAKAQWMKTKEIYYWGDIDTHGFAILNQFREYFPETKSFLMDRSTLLAHEAHWGTEARPAKAETLPYLDHEEALLYRELKEGSISHNLRLEQEFVSYSLVEDFVKGL